MDGGLAALLNQPYSLAHVGNVSAYLTKVLEKTEDVRDFHWLLPKLLAHIFGVDTRPGWLELARVTAEYNALHQLLRPNGPLFQLILREWRTPYELDEDRFPVSVQKVLSGMAPRQMSMFGKADLAQFFTRRLHQGRDPSKWCIKLDMIEYYVYCLLYFANIAHTTPPSEMPAVNQPRPLAHLVPRITGVVADGTNDVYINLVQEYALFFIPIPAAVKPARAPAATLAASPRQFLQQQLPLAPPLASVDAPAVNVITCATPERPMTGMTEFFVDAVIQLWLSQNDFSRPSTSLIAPSPLLCRSIHKIARHVSFSHALHPAMKTASPEHSRFASTAQAMLQPILFRFITGLIKRAVGTDAFMPIVIDIWAAYVLPWDQSPPVGPNHKAAFSMTWMPFVLDNFPFYSEVLRALLRGRIMLPLVEANAEVGTLAAATSVVTSSVMLLEQLRKAENDYFSAKKSPYGGHNAGDAAAIAAISKSLQVLRVAPTEFLPLFTLRSMDSLHASDTLYMQIRSLQAALLMTIEQCEAMGARPNSTPSTALFSSPASAMTTPRRGGATEAPLLSGVKHLLGQDSGNPAQRLQTHLKNLITFSMNLARIFVDVPGYEQRAVTRSGESSSSVGGARAPAVPPLSPQSDEKGMLTELGKAQLRSGIRKTSKLSKTPVLNHRDRSVVKSYEIGFLVQPLERLSDAVNAQWARYVQHLNATRGISLPAGIAGAKVNLRLFAAYPNLLFMCVVFVVMWLVWTVARLASA